jgi:hypothetical protein
VSLHTCESCSSIELEPARHPIPPGPEACRCSRTGGLPLASDIRSPLSVTCPGSVHQLTGSAIARDGRPCNTSDTTGRGMRLGMRGIMTSLRRAVQLRQGPLTLVSGRWLTVILNPARTAHAVPIHITANATFSVSPRTRPCTRCPWGIRRPLVGLR